MTSPRFSRGEATRLGEASLLPAGEIADGIYEAEADIRRLTDAVPLGSVALLDIEYPILRDRLPARTTFVSNQDFSLGRDEGRHQPKFGQLLINGSGIHEQPTLVTMKPFEGNLDENPDEYLAREWAVNNYLNTLNDRQLAFLPLGVWKNVEGINHLITLYDHDVISYDNTFWADRDATPEALRPDNIERGLDDCIKGLGYLHGVGLAHTDAEAKNLAANRTGIRFIDTEGVQVLPQKDGVIEVTDRTVELMQHDVETFLTSTMQVEANREKIAPILAKNHMDERLAKLYRRGLREAKADTGIKMPPVSTSHAEYFKEAIAQSLRQITPSS